MTALFGVFSFRSLFAPDGMAKEFSMDKSSIYIIRVLGAFITPFFLIGVYLILIKPINKEIKTKINIESFNNNNNNNNNNSNCNHSLFTQPIM